MKTLVFGDTCHLIQLQPYVHFSERFGTVKRIAKSVKIIEF